MRLLPIDLTNARFPRAAMGGYRHEEVDALIDRAAEALEELTAENEDLRSQIVRLRHEVEQMRGEEKLVKEAIVSAQRAAEFLRSDAGREADLIREEARQQARADRTQAQKDAERLQDEVAQLQVMRKRLISEHRAFLEKSIRDLNEIDPPARTPPPAPVPTVTAPVAEAPTQPYPTRLGATKPMEPIIVEDENGEMWVS